MKQEKQTASEVHKEQDDRRQRNRQIHIHFDPLREFTDIPQARLRDACGLLPGFVVSDAHLHLSLKETLDAQYCCGLFDLGGNVDAQGIYTYPGDPELHPFVKINRGDEIFYQYRNAIVAIVSEKGETFITRMD